MIKLDELKPILSELMNDENSVSLIDKITAIDVHESVPSGFTQEDVDERIETINKEWNEKFRNAFLQGVDAGNTSTIIDNAGNDVDGDTEPDVPETFEELFTEGE